MNTVIKCSNFYLAPPTRDIYIAKKSDIPYSWQRKGINKVMAVLIKHKCWQENKHIFKLDEYIAPPKWIYTLTEPS